MRLTQGQFSFLPDLTDDEIKMQIQYALDQGWAVAVEFTVEVRPDALEVGLQRLALLVLEVLALVLATSMEQRPHARVDVGRRGRNARVEVHVQADRAALLRAKPRELSKSVPTHRRSHGASLCRKAAILCV